MDNSFQNLLNVEEYNGLSAIFPVMVLTGNRIHPGGSNKETLRKVLLTELWAGSRELTSGEVSRN